MPSSATSKKVIENTYTHNFVDKYVLYDIDDIYTVLIIVVRAWTGVFYARFVHGE